MGTHGLIFLALVPGIIIIIYVYKMDKVEKEPWGLILKLIIFGMISCVPASFMEIFVEQLTPAYQEGTIQYALTMAFLSAALCEEICKYALLKIGSWNSRYFGYRFDGIVYGVAVAIGFAVLENVLYVIEGGLYVALMRGVMAVPLHAFCGLFMGVFYGAAKKAKIEGRSALKYKFLALFVPFMIHGVYDTLAFMGTTSATVILLAFVVVMYIVSVRCIRAYSRDDASSAFSPFGSTLSGNAGDGISYESQSAPRYELTVISCPNCHGRLKIPTGMGRLRIKCPHCGSLFEETP